MWFSSNSVMVLISLVLWCLGSPSPASGQVTAARDSSRAALTASDTLKRTVEPQAKAVHDSTQKTQVDSATRVKGKPKPPKPTWQSVPHVVYNHAACKAGQPITSTGCSPRFHLSLGNGQVFAIAIVGTDTARFDYSIESIVRAPGKQILEAGTDVNDTLVLRQQHDKRYGGYIIHIVARKNNPSKARNPADITIEVKTLEWELEFGGGFTVSGVKDPVYAVVADTIVDSSGTTPAPLGVLRIKRQKKAEDEQRLGLGSFVHVYTTRLPGLGISFGLGLEQNRAASYYFGPSIRLGGKATLTSGLLWGNVKTLPPGFSERQIVADANVINGSGNRTQRSWFVAISYSFIGGADKALAKPFADQPPVPGTQSTTPAGGAGNGSAGDSTGVIAAFGDTTIHVGDTLVASFTEKKGDANDTIPVTFVVRDSIGKPTTTGFTLTPMGPITPKAGTSFPITIVFTSDGEFRLVPVFEGKEGGEVIKITVKK